MNSTVRRLELVLLPLAPSVPVAGLTMSAPSFGATETRKSAASEPPLAMSRNCVLTRPSATTWPKLMLGGAVTLGRDTEEEIGTRRRSGASIELSTSTSSCSSASPSASVNVTSTLMLCKQ